MAAQRGTRLVCTPGQAALALTLVIGVATAAPAQQPIAGANVNMIRGTTLPDGDPSMQRQNEPSIAISTRNPCHLLGGANDYRILASPDPFDLPNPTGMAADAWLSVMKSFDCGTTWKSTLLPGYPDQPATEAGNSPLRGYQAGADATVRAGTNGLFYYSGIVFDRDPNGKSRLFVARFIDNNDKELGDTIKYLGTSVVMDGTKGQFVDKPWLAVDVPRTSFGVAGAYATGAGPFCTIDGQQIPRANVYIAWARFTGNTQQHDNSKVMFARSINCGLTWETQTIASSNKTSQGTALAIAPDDGTVYLAWREFEKGAPLGAPSSIQIIRSRNGGASFEKLPPVIATFSPFDHPKSSYTFRSTALPVMAAAPGGLVYLAIAARGYAKNLDGSPNDDGRVLLAISTNGGSTFAKPIAIDNNPRTPNPLANPTSPPRGHQFMPALSYAAGRLQIAFYDARDDVSPQRGTFISDDPAINGNPYRHTLDVRGSWAPVSKANPIPLFGVFSKTPQGVTEQTTLKLSRYLQSASLGTVNFNYANLTMYQGGLLPFIGDYMDSQGLSAIPVRTANDVQEWRPNIPINLGGMSALSTQAFPTLPVFHVAWGDNRDVKWLAKIPGPYFDIKNQFAIPAYCEAALDVTGIRNANIYTSRMTPGLYVGSTGNTKPLGFVRDPFTGGQVLIRRGFTAFVQNTTGTPARYRLEIVNQPPGGRVSFRQSDEHPVTHVDRGPLTTLDAEVPAGSSIARTVHAQAPDRFAQILINVFELEGVPGTDANGKPIIVYNPKPNGLKSSLLLNPDKTNPALKNPDLILDPNDPAVIPQIAIAESHDPRISEAFAFDLQGLLTTRRAITVPAQSGDPSDPNAPVETPDLESPDLESPDLESPDLESPDLESPDLESGALGEGESLDRIRDIHWTAKNGGNTTTTYRFRPSVNADKTGLKFQMVVSRRYLAPAIDPGTCELVFKTVTQVVVNVPNFEPRSPDLESPDLESPDLESPDLESPDLESASLNNVTFALAPGEEATMTLRVMKVNKGSKGDDAAAGEPGAAAAETGFVADGDASFDGAAAAGTSARANGLGAAFATSASAVVQQASCTSILDVDANGKPCGTRVATTAFIQSQAANCVAATCEAVAPSASAGPDLVVSEASLVTNTAAIGGVLGLNAMVMNVGNAPTEGAFATRFFLSTGPTLTFDDGEITDIELTPAFLRSDAVPPEGPVHIANHQVTIPRGTRPGSYFVIVYTDGHNDIFEPNNFNNDFTIAGTLSVGYALTFTVQPSPATQDFSITPPVVVSVTDGAGVPVSAETIPIVSIQLNDGGIGGTPIQPNIDGTATFADLNVHFVGNHALIATAAGALQATSSIFNVKQDVAPITRDDSYVIRQGQTLQTADFSEFLPRGPLQNDSDEIKDGPGIAPANRRLTISIVSQPTHGTLTVRPDQQNFVYTPNPEYFGLDAFTYRANDGLQDSALPAATVSIDVRRDTEELAVVTSELPAADIDGSYFVALEAGGSTDTPFVWDLAPGSEPLPPWLTLGADGSLFAESVDAADCSSFAFTVRVTDQLGRTATRDLTLSVVGSLGITSGRFHVIALENFARAVTTRCSVGALRWSIEGALPRGVTFDTSAGQFSSALAPPNPLVGLGPKETGDFPVELTVSDAITSRTDTVTLSIHAVDQQPITGGEETVETSDITRIAQTFTVGAAGQLTAIRVRDITCDGLPHVDIRIVGVKPNGEPDESRQYGSAFITAPDVLLPLDVTSSFTVDQRFAVVLRVNRSCTISRLSNVDSYVGGAAFVSSEPEGGWSTPISSGGMPVADFRIFTLIQNPAFTYLSRNNGQAHAVTLHDGRILMVGFNGIAEIIDVESGEVTPVAMIGSRIDPTVTLLPDGRVLVTGGQPPGAPFGSAVASAELFDPASMSFVEAQSMTEPRMQHAAVLLTCGTREACAWRNKVLVTGGNTPTGPASFATLSSAEIYDVATGTWSAAGQMLARRNSHQMTRLFDGRVLITGGFGPQTGAAEIYDPATGTYAATAALLARRAEHTATLLPDGKVLIGGGRLANAPRTLASRAEIYSPAANPADATLTDGGPMITPRARHSATLLLDGSVLLTGGIRNFEFIGPPHASAERYVAGAGFVGAPSLATGRYDHGTVLLDDGRVLAVGGFNGVGGSRQPGQTFELYNPSAEPDGVPAIANPNLPDGFVDLAYPPTTLSGVGGTAPFTFFIDPASLPPGLSLGEGGTITGTPRAAGVYPFTVVITDSGEPRRVGRQTLRIRINALDITTLVLPRAFVGIPYSVTVEATGVGEKRWTMSGNVPPGDPPFTIDPLTGVITGTPTGTGFYDVFVRVRDALGQTAFRTLSIQIAPPLRITSETLGDGILGDPYFDCVNSAGGVGALSWTLSGNYPNGLAFRNGGVNNSCFDTTVPARQLRQTGEFTFTATVTDSNVPPQVVSRQFTIRIHAHDQAFGNPFGGSVQLSADTRYAQVFTAGTAFPLSGIQLWTFRSCSPKTLINVEIRSVVGAPARPDDSGAPLATASAIANDQGFFNHILRLSTPVAVPQHGRFAAMVKLQNGSCEAAPWSPTNEYLPGDGWVNAGSGWELLADAIGISDMRINTLVMPNDLVYPTSRRDFGHRSVMLADGRILIFGPDATADIYDPATHSVMPTANMSTPRSRASATLLDDGRVVIIGGSFFDDATNTTVALSSIEIFNPAANDGGGGFVPAGALHIARADHTATLVSGGRILVTGGYAWPGNGLDHLRSAEIYDIAEKTSTPPFDMLMSRAQHTATLLPGNRVLLAGGYSDGPFPGSNAEIYDLGAHAFRPTANQMQEFRSQHTATMLLSGFKAGHVILIGGTGNHPNLAGNEYFDPDTEAFSPAPSLLRPRTNHTTVMLFHGQLMVLGGYDRFGSDGRAIADVEVFDPAAERFTPAADLRVTRQSPSAHMLTRGPRAGSVFAVGGGAYSALASRSGEIVSDSPAALVITTASLPDGSVGVAYPRTTLAAVRGFEPYTFDHVWGQLPPGLTFANGVISGTPQARGSYPIVVQVTDVLGTTALKAFTIAIGRLTITSPHDLPPAVVGLEYNYQMTADGLGSLHWMLTNSSLPDGFTFDANGVIRGTASAEGFFTIDVRVSDASGQMTVEGFHFRVTRPLDINDSVLPDGFVGEFGGGGLFVQGGNGQRHFVVIDESQLPRGSTIDPEFGFMTGIPLQVGTFEFDVRVTDCFNNSCLPGITPQTDSAHVVWRIDAIDQSSGADFSPNGRPVAIRGIMPAQEVAFTGVTGTAGYLLGLRLNQLTCEPDSRIRVSLYPTTGNPPVPDESGLPLAFAIRVNPLPFFPINFDGLGHYFPAGSSFAIVLSADGACTLSGASATDTYPRGRALVRSTATNGWEPGTTPDVPWQTFVLPETGFTWSEHYSSGHASTRLDTNRILLSGGTNDQVAQIYDASAPVPLSPAGTMIEQRYQATATLLPDGRVVVIGGERYTPSGTEYSASAEIWNPVDKTWSRVASEMPEGRSQHTATLLINGFVLVAGGFNSSGVLQSAVIFDPAANGGDGGFRPIANLLRGRAAHTASAIVAPGPDQGKVLFAGGWNGPATEDVTLELFDPELETFHHVDDDGGAMQMKIPRARHTATTLPNGQILFIGGHWTFGPSLATHAEIFTPPSLSNFGARVEMSGAHLVPRVEHTATLLPDGSVLVAGGMDHPNWDNVSTATTERWRRDPENPDDPGRFLGNGNLGVARADHSAEAFADGSVVFVGGTDISVITPHSTERFEYDGTIGVAAYVLPEAGVANEYDGRIQATGGSGQYLVQLVSGTLPPGVTLADSGVLTGAPTTAGTFVFTVKITDIGTNQFTYQTVRVEVKSTFSIARNVLHAVVGEPFTTGLEATGGSGTASWQLEPGYGSVPAGLIVDGTGQLSGTPAQAGHFSFMMRAADNNDAFPQFAMQRIRMSVADRDQKQLAAPGRMTAGGAVVLAQVITAGVAGTLSGVRVPIGCTSGALYVDVRDAFNGFPGNQILATQFFANAAAAFPEHQWTTIPLPPVFMRQGEQFTIVLLVADFGTCSVGTAEIGQTYGGGDLLSSPPWDQSTWMITERDLAFETLVEPVRFTHFGAANIDGDVSPDEWVPAGQMHFIVNLPNGETAPATLMVMNDTVDVYMNIVYERDARDAHTFTNFNTDNDNDGRSYQVGEDLWSLNGDGSSASGFFDSVGIAGGCVPPRACQWVGDARGTGDGQGQVGLNGNVYALEAKHALNSGDPDDIALRPGQRFGVNINMSVMPSQQFDASSGFTQIPMQSDKAVPVTVVNPPQSIGPIELGPVVTDAFAINNDGSVTGNVSFTGTTHAFLSERGIASDIHQLGTNSFGNAINDRGIVSGNYIDASGTRRAFMWSAGSASDLGNFGLALDTVANGINSAGAIVGGSSAMPSMVQHAYRWTPAGIEDLHQLGGSSEAFDINNTGQIVGTFEGAATRAFVLTYGGTMIDLGTLGGASAEARAVNDSGVIVGSSDRSDGFRHAFKYDRGEMTDLGAFPGSESHAWGINSHGVVVGDSGGKAVMFTDAKVIDLNSLLPQGSGWLLSVARGINDAGQITGYGSFNGRSRAFVLNTPP